MTYKQIEVGDVVAWAEIPPWSMWRHKCGTYETRHEIAVYALDRYWRRSAPTGYEALADEPPVTIVAIGLTGQESADDLRRLAEAFEVLTSPLVAAVGMLIERGQAQTRGTVGDALHAAGSRSGMTAEDAARLLSERA